MASYPRALFAGACVWGFHRTGPARLLCTLWLNQDRMCALLLFFFFFSRERKIFPSNGEKIVGSEGTRTRRHLRCVELVKRPPRLKRHRVEGDMFSGGSNPMSEGTGRLQRQLGKSRIQKTLPDALYAPLCLLPSSACTHALTIRANTLSSLWAPAPRECPPKQLSFLNLDVLTIRIVGNENHSWAVERTGRRNAMRKHDHIKTPFIYFELTHGISRPTITGINERMPFASPEALLWLQSTYFSFLKQFWIKT